MLIKHATASTFVFAPPPGPSPETDLGLALLWHKKFDRWMIPGGHVEPNENCAEAAKREVREETTLDVQLVDDPRAAPSPEGAALVPMPWMVVEQRIPARGTESEHVHIDHLFVAQPTCREATLSDARWFSVGGLDALLMFDDTRALARTFAATLGRR